MGKYFLSTARYAKAQEFLELKQGAMTMIEYVAKFIELADEYLKYSFYPYDLVIFSSVFMLNKCPNALKVHTYDQVIHLVELYKIGGKTPAEATGEATAF